MSRGFRIITGTFMAAGIFLLLAYHQPYTVWIAGFNSMINIVSVLIVMQLFSIPIEAGGYNASVRLLLTNSFKSEKGLFLFSTIVTHLFASFLLFGTIPVMFSLFGDSLKRSVSNFERFIAAAISRGYTLVSLWAPGAINLMLVMQVFKGIKWIELVVPGILISIIGIATSYLIESRKNLSSEIISKDAGEHTAVEIRAARFKACHIISVIMALGAITAILEHIRFGVPTNRIMIAALIVFAIWTVRYVSRPSFNQVLGNYWKHGLLKTGDLAPLFISMGLFSTAFQKSGVMNEIQPILQPVATMMGAYTIIAVPVVMILFSIIGLHPFISIVLFGQILVSLSLPVPPVTLALCLALGGAVSYAVSPFAGVILTLAKFSNCRAVDIALRWNWKYSLMLLAEGLIFDYCWGRMFG
jgi:hypothetical protein